MERPDDIDWDNLPFIRGDINKDPYMELLRGENRKFSNSKLLGQDLTMLEEKMYRQIHLSGDEPISAEKVFAKVYPKSLLNGDPIRYTVWVTITRIREKLGHEAIITHKGYITRRSKIDAIVKKNIQRSKKYGKRSG